MRPSMAAAWVALIGAASACNVTPPTSPSAGQLTERLTTEHFLFRYSPGDRVDTAWQETYHAWAVAQLEVTPPQVTYNKYRDRAHMRALTGRETNGFADLTANTLHTIWPTDNHEVVHVYAAPWGFPVALLVEGLAVAHQMNPAAVDFVAKWNGTPLHTHARQFRASGQLLSIASIAETVPFRARNAEITYPQSGSFVRFLIDTEGLPAMRRLFGAMGNDASIGTIRAAFQGVYGFSLDEAEARWLRFLDGS